MPFKSEKQRRYLWANEPEIARDWTDTYGSRIKKAEGGITKVAIQGGGPNYLGKQPEVKVPKKWKSSPDHPDTELAYITEPEKKVLIALNMHGGLEDGKPNKGPKGIISLQGDMGSVKSDGKGGHVGTGGGDYPSGKSPELPPHVKAAIAAGKPTSVVIKEEPKKSILTKIKEANTNLQTWANKKYLMKNIDYYARNKKLAPILLELLRGGKFDESDYLGLEDASPLRLQAQFGDIDQEYKDEIRKMSGVLGQDMVTRKDIKEWLPTPPTKIGGDGQGGQGYMGYPSYAAWLAAQNQGGGGTIAPTAATASTPSAFQQSLNTGATSSVPYYVGADPTAANLAWGQQFNVDPRTMYRTTWADGGPIRQRYFLGKLVKKIGRAAKKVIKSPIGKIGIGALAMGMPWGAGANFGAMGGKGWFGSQSGWGKIAPWILGKKDYKGVGDDYDGRTGGLLDLLFKSGKEGSRTWNPWKIGIGAATLAPFLMGGGDDKEQDKAFDYDAAKNAYMNEIMNIRRGALAGTLDPNQFVYQGIKDGGRIGYAGGGDTWQDFLQATDVWVDPVDKDWRDVYYRWLDNQKEKRAQGGRIGYANGGSGYEEALTLAFKQYQEAGGTMSIKEFADAWMKEQSGHAQGGRIGYQGGGMEDPLLVDEYKKYVFEMEEMGLQPMSFEEFKQQAIAGMASGGRAGYYAGGQSIPSENTMIDASKTAMQDRLGGITDVMKTADLYRQGDIGQMYMAEGGPTQEAGIMDLGGVEKDYRETGGFVPIGKEEKADDVPARLSLNEFVMTADAVRGMGDGDIDQGAERMEDLMETLEVKGKKNQGAQDMFEVSERLSAVV